VCRASSNWASVKGQDEVLSGGLVTSTWADSRNPCWWPGDLRKRSGQGCHPLPGQRLLEAVGVALGGDQVGVMEEPVDGGGGQCLGHDRVEPRRVNVAGHRDRAPLVCGIHYPVERLGGVLTNRQPG